MSPVPSMTRSRAALDRFRKEHADAIDQFRAGKSPRQVIKRVERGVEVPVPPDEQTIWLPDNDPNAITAASTPDGYDGTHYGALVASGYSSEDARAACRAENLFAHGYNVDTALAIAAREREITRLDRAIAASRSNT